MFLSWQANISVALITVFRSPLFPWFMPTDDFCSLLVGAGGLFSPCGVHRCCSLLTVLIRTSSFCHRWYLLIWRGWLYVCKCGYVYLCVAYTFVIFTHLAGCALQIYARVPLCARVHSPVIFAQPVMQVARVCEAEVCHVWLLSCFQFDTLKFCNNTHTHNYLTLGAILTDGGHKFISHSHETGFKCKAPAVTFIGWICLWGRNAQTTLVKTQRQTQCALVSDTENSTGHL